MILNPLFSDHMVLQRRRPIRVFGMGVGRVEVEFLGKKYSHYSHGGNWCFELDPAEAGGPYEMTVSLDGETRVLRDVLVGEVFIAGGQSNMQVVLGENGVIATPDLGDGQTELTPAQSVLLSSTPIALPSVRFFGVVRPESCGFTGRDWQVADENTCRGMSAIGWIFARRMWETYGVPVGIVTCYQGAAILQSFIEKNMLRADPAGQRMSLQRARSVVNYPVWNFDGMIYDFMVRRIMPLAFRAVLWYQGESNSDPVEGELFVDLMRLLRDCWREAFKYPELPIIQVQITPFGTGNPRGWLAIQEGQARAAKELEGVYLVTGGDVGEEKNIHPVRKEPIADRLFRAVRHEIFGETEIPYLGPEMRECRFEGGRVTVTFDGVGTGLTQDGEIDNFVLVDENGTRHPAVCRITGKDTLTAEAPIANATAAEFAYTGFNVMHLFSSEGLPAQLFRCEK